MGGCIEVTSTLDKGSSFTVLLPLALCGHQHGQKQEKPDLPAAWEGRSLHILVAEDNNMSRQLVCKLLESVGHHTKGVADGLEALAAWKLEKFDLILMDIDMPEMDGNMVTRLIRDAEKHSGEQIPIIALTVHALPHERDLALAAGMNNYVTKPVALKELLVAIKEAVESVQKH